MQLELRRFSHTNHGTFGVLGLITPDGLMPICVTLEDPWLDNKPNESCIPEGFYTCEAVKSPKFGDSYEVKYVIGRTNILFHTGNKIEDTHGCILLATTFDHKEKQIRYSLDGYLKFEDALGDADSFKLTIRNPT